MKKRKLSDVCGFETQIRTNQIRPYCSVAAQAILNGTKLKIELIDSIKGAKECFIVAYDKKTQQSLAVQKVTDARKRSVDILFSMEFMNTLYGLSDFKYARLCIAILWEEKYAFFYLDKEITEDEYKEEKNYVGNVAECLFGKKNIAMVLYYSSTGQLSLKPMEVIHYPKKYIEKMLNEQAQVDKSNYTFNVSNGILTVVSKFVDNQFQFIEEIKLNDLFLEERITISGYVPDADKNRVLWIEQLDSEGILGNKAILCCYTGNQDDELYMSAYSCIEHAYKKFLHFDCKNLKIWISRKQLHIRFDGVVYTEKKHDLNVDKIELVIDDNHRYPIELVGMDKEQTKNIKKDLKLKSIIEQETSINNSIHIAIWVNGVCCQYNLGNKCGKEEETKYYYIPSTRGYIDDWVVFIRQNMHQNYVMVVRMKEPEEKRIHFWIFENLLVSAVLYYIGKLIKKIRNKKVNLFFEKDSMKAEEGTFEVFQKVSNHKNSRNYYILDSNSKQWKDLKRVRNVVRRYSLKYYFLIYMSSFFISTEMSSHLNVHRSANCYLRRALLDCPLFFLQHGITYLKCQGKSSVFGKGKEGEPNYIVVGSEKEKQVVCQMLQLEAGQCVMAGLPVFDTIQHNHINLTSENIVTIMLTWKPEEEHMQTHFEDSSYYKSVKLIYDILKNLLPKEQIWIEPHPKVFTLLQRTDLRERLCEGSVADTLKKTKLLITDYSSVCYNSFFQGAGVIFYQPDLYMYESRNGELIPKDNEYIGYRVFYSHELEEILRKGIINQQVDLNYFRKKEFENRYNQINEFHDGKNVERIVKFLEEKNIV